MKSQQPLTEPGEATVRIWHDNHGQTRWGLDWVIRDPLEQDSWIAMLASRIHKLGWNTWWLDLTCLTRTMMLPPEKALEAWGMLFWSVYTDDALVFLDVDQQRRTVYQAVRHWEERFSTIRFSSEHDYDC